MIRQQAIIAKRPPENIVQEEDSHILLLIIIIVAGDIDVMVEDFGFPALRVAVPGEAGGAAGGGHLFCVCLFR